MSDTLHAVICYWEYTGDVKRPNKENFKAFWTLKESYGIDDDGHPLTTPSTGGGARVEWDKWMNKKVKKIADRIEDDGDDDDYYDDWEPIMGRAVTICDLEHGVRLLDMNPPEFVGWLSTSFYEELCIGCFFSKEDMNYILAQHKKQENTL